MHWYLSNRFDPAAVAIADRHYNRQKIGTPQFVPPGRCLVLLAPGAVWVTSWPEYAQHEWKGAWMNTIFRNEHHPAMDAESSTLIREAVAATVWRWDEVPTLGMVTFVDPKKVRHKRDPGRCFLRAGFEPCGVTKERGYLAFRMRPEAMPPPAMPIGAQATLALSAGG